MEKSKRITAEKEKEEAEQRAIVAERKRHESDTELKRLKEKLEMSDRTS